MAVLQFPKLRSLTPNPPRSDRTHLACGSTTAAISQAPTNVPPDLMRDMLLAPDAPPAEAHCVCPQCHPQCRLPALAKLAQLASLTPRPCVQQGARIQHLWLATLTETSEFHLYYDI